MMQTWLTVNPVSGTGNETLTATYTENTTTSQRVGTITVTGGGITRTVTVTQAAGPVSTNSKSIKPVSNECIRKYNIYSNIKYKLDS